MQSFQKAIETLDEDEKPSILLANGFSQAWNATIFNYANLFEAADFGDREDVIRPLFINLGTYDFESIMKQLVSTEAVLNAYGADKELIENIVSDKEVLKKALVDAILNTHPSLPSDVEDSEYITVRTFLSQFNEVFSINYDLLFYWARNKNNLDPKNYSTDDGFRAEKCWEGHDTNQEVYFLHGGLHIYDTGTHIKKHVCTDAGVTIIDQVRNNLNEGTFPLFVSEPNHQKKKQRIDHNPYLNYCYQALGELSGTFFIHGHSMNDTDKHIFDRIKSSRVSRIFVSIYGDESSDKNSRTKANALTFLSGSSVAVEFYRAESAPVWA